MPIFDIYTHIIDPLVEGVKVDSRFQNVSVFYDEDIGSLENIPIDRLPILNIFLSDGAGVEGAGSNTGSFSVRQMNVSLTIAILTFDNEKYQVDRELSLVLGDLLDYLNERRNWDNAFGLSDVKIALGEDLDVSFISAAEEGGFLGIWNVRLEFTIYAGC